MTKHLQLQTIEKLLQYFYNNHSVWTLRYLNTDKCEYVCEMNFVLLHTLHPYYHFGCNVERISSESGWVGNIRDDESFT